MQITNQDITSAIHIHFSLAIFFCFKVVLFSKQTWNNFTASLTHWGINPLEIVASSSVTSSKSSPWIPIRPWGFHYGSSCTIAIDIHVVSWCAGDEENMQIFLGFLISDFCRERDIKEGEIRGKQGHPFWREIGAYCDDIFAPNFRSCKAHAYNFGDKCQKRGNVHHLYEFRGHRSIFFGLAATCKRSKGKGPTCF